SRYVVSLHSIHVALPIFGVGKVSGLVFIRELIPQFLRATASQCMFFLNASAQSYNFFSRVVASNVFPTGVGIPVLLNLVCCCLDCLFHVSPYITVLRVSFATFCGLCNRCMNYSASLEAQN